MGAFISGIKQLSSGSMSEGLLPALPRRLRMIRNGRLLRRGHEVQRLLLYKLLTLPTSKLR